MNSKLFFLSLFLINLGARIGIMRRGELVKTLPADQVTVNELQVLYLSTI